MARTHTRFSHVAPTAPLTPATYTLSLHDALPIFQTQPASAGSSISLLYKVTTPRSPSGGTTVEETARRDPWIAPCGLDRKSTRLNSSHRCISYAVFCLK